MPYVPKNRIQTNLYTAGGELRIKGNISSYIGYYYKIYTGKFFTGKNPSNPPNFELEPIPGDSPQNGPINFYAGGLTSDFSPSINQKTIDDETANIYNFLKPLGKDYIPIPQLFYTEPTQSDYQLGEFQRYFCKKRNEFIYLEISKSDYSKLVKQDSAIDFINWAPFSIPWTLTGGESQVYNTNKNIVLLEEKNKKFYGFRKYLREDYLRYYKS